MGKHILSFGTMISFVLSFVCFITITNTEDTYNYLNCQSWVELLIRAIPKIIEKRDDIRFLVIGNGSKKQELIELSQKLRICKYLKFLGSVPNSKMPLLFKASDVYVSTSLSDSTSVALHEAMACGAFPVITNIEGNRPWVENGKNGILVPTNNPDILATSIINAFENNDLRESAKTINWNIVKERGNSIVTKNEIERIYFKLIKKGNRKNKLSFSLNHYF